MEKSLNLMLERSFKENWNNPALSDYKGVTLHYRDVARRIEKLHIVFEICGLKKGDKVSICSKNQANWGVVFLATITYGAVAVPILHEFKPGNIHHIVNHSDSRILFIGDQNWELLSETEMPNLEVVIQISDFSVLFAKAQLVYETREHLNELFGKKYPKYFRPEHISYFEDSHEELALINYTSGTTGFSKGVMLPFRSLISNVEFGMEVQPQLNNTSRVVAMLPTAHMYGMMFEFLFEMTVGAHVYFLTRIPSPKIIMEAFAEIKPHIVVSVPLIIEKIYKKKLQPIISKTSMRVLLRVPVIDQKIQRKIQQELVKTFGGRFREVIVGGAAFNKEAEVFFRKIGFPFTVGYGMTECGPIITYAPWDNTRLYSCGKAVPRMSIKIDSDDPKNIPGEIMCKGTNMMLGYFKNQEATDSVLKEDGWLRTGDMGVIDDEGFLYIRGRSKSMILGPNGQNIYPEEIESLLNNMQYVNESLVIEEQGSLTVLIYPDFELAEQHGLSTIDLEKKMEENRVAVNDDLPNFCKIQTVKIFPEEFEKTPKRSIKRFLYQRLQG
ncbi:MAG: long-chain fatty acid--CoA ligase [Bacteroidetes bacterium GWF2_40_14]|nr:MAG: long-chain fatty acid--CoA ligase [Bacteroidetes bacterium GWF2_40_14]